MAEERMTTGGTWSGTSKVLLGVVVLWLQLLIMQYLFHYAADECLLIISYSSGNRLLPTLEERARYVLSD